MDKKIISRILFVIMLITNIYLNDAGINQRTGVGQLESFWTKYIGGSKGSGTYEDRERAESDSQTSTYVLIVLDVVLIGAIYFLNKKPKPKPAPVEDDSWRRIPRRGRRR